MYSSSQPPDVSTTEGPQVNRFEQLSSLGYQMSLAGSWGPVQMGGLYSEVQFIMGNCHIGPSPCNQTHITDNIALL